MFSIFKKNEESLLDRLKQSVSKTRSQIVATAEELKTELRNQLLHVLRTLPSSNGSSAPVQETRPHVIFVVGVNGTGKTTTIGKLAHRLRRDGRTVVLAAADTFRAAAIEQLGV